MSTDRSLFKAYLAARVAENRADAETPLPVLELLQRETQRTWDAWQKVYLPQQIERDREALMAKVRRCWEKDGSPGDFREYVMSHRFEFVAIPREPETVGVL